MRHPENRVLHDSLTGLAAVLLTSVAYLLGETDDPTPDEARFVGYVGAGAVILSGDLPPEMIESPPGLKGALAAKVRGDSMQPVYSNDDMLYFQPATPTAEAIIGRDCLVEVDDGRRLVKKVKKSRKSGHFRLLSYSKKYRPEDVKLIAAAPVKWIKRA